MRSISSWPIAVAAAAVALASGTSPALSDPTGHPPFGPSASVARQIRIGPLRLAWRPGTGQDASAPEAAGESPSTATGARADQPAEPLAGPSLIGPASQASSRRESPTHDSPTEVAPPEDAGTKDDPAEGDTPQRAPGNEGPNAGGSEGESLGTGSAGASEDESKREPDQGEEAEGAKPSDAADPTDPAKREQLPDEAPETTPPRPPLSEALVKLRDQVRQALARHARQPLSTARSTPSDVLLFCLPYGCQTTILTGSRSAKRISALGALCWNYPCAGMRLLGEEEGGVVARIGYGLQGQPSQMLATLALARVPGDYEIRAGAFQGRVADLVESEKRHCYRGQDLSLTLVGLSHYLDEEATWENATGQTWSLERLVSEELDRQVAPDDSPATNRLLGLSYAVDRHRRRLGTVSGPYARAEAFLRQFQQFALGLQNADGSWHPRFFAARGAGGDASGRLRATGHILAWLVISLPEDRLEDTSIVRSVSYLASNLASPRSRSRNLPATPRGMDGLMHALHALALYDQRVFQPRDPLPATEASQDETGPEGTSG